jgi:hypothetical protein
MHEKNENNIVNASWLFHQCFYGLVTKGIIPLLIVRPERVYQATTFELGGREYKRYRIDVLMDFTTKDGLEQITPCLHEAPQLVGTKLLRTYIHAIDAHEMCRFFELKHGETAAAWKSAEMDVPEF